MKDYTSEGNVIEVRAWRRTDVREPAEIHMGDSLVTGHLRDFGGGGVFFEPDLGYLDGQMVQGLDCLDYMDMGDTFTIVVFGHKILAKIAWSGFSQRHGTWGLGVQFANPLFMPVPVRPSASQAFAKAA